MGFGDIFGGLYDDLKLGGALLVDTVAGTSLASQVYADQEAATYDLTPAQRDSVAAYSKQVDVPAAVKTELKKTADAVIDTVKPAFGFVETLAVCAAVVAVAYVAGPFLRKAASS